MRLFSATRIILDIILFFDRIYRIDFYHVTKYQINKTFQLLTGSHFWGIWEQLYNMDFNSLEFEGIKNQAGYNRFTLSAKKWIAKTNAIGLIAKTGR